MEGYENYSFVLDWDELDEELKEEKITEFMEKNYVENDERGYDEYMDDPNEKESAENAISAHFPMYF